MIKQISQSILLAVFALLFVSCASLRSRTLPEVEVKPPIAWVIFDPGQECTLAIGERAYFRYQFDVQEEEFRIWLRAETPRGLKSEFSDHGFVIGSSTSPIYMSSQGTVLQSLEVFYQPERDKYRGELKKNQKAGLVFRKELTIIEIEFRLKNNKTGKTRDLCSVPVDITWICEKDESARQIKKWTPEAEPVK